MPSSFLIDEFGEVAVIYKGKVSVDQILSDLKLLDVNAEQRRALALP